MSDASPLFCFLPYAFSFRCAKLSGTNCCGASQSAACPSDAGDERKYVHSRPPRSACCSLPPSADGARAGMQTDPTACRSDTAPSTHHHHHPSHHLSAVPCCTGRPCPHSSALASCPFRGLGFPSRVVASLVAQSHSVCSRDGAECMNLSKSE